jgi:hypothetical protein
VPPPAVGIVNVCTSSARTPRRGPAEVDQGAERQAGIDGEVLAGRGDEVLDPSRVRQGALGQEPVDDPAHERLLVADAGVVCVGEGMSFSHERQCLFTVEVVLAGDDLVRGRPVDREGLRGVDGDASECVGHPREAGEVDLGHVVDPDVEELLDRLHREGDPAPGVRGVDLRRAVAGDVDPRVPHDRHQVHGLPVRRHVGQHQRVRTAALAVTTVGSGDGAGVGADEQDVLRRGSGSGTLAGGEGVGDGLGVPVVAPGEAADEHARDDGDHPGDPEERAERGDEGDEDGATTATRTNGTTAGHADSWGRAGPGADRPRLSHVVFQR